MNAAPNDNDTVVPVAWYKPSQWQRLEEIAPDVAQTWQSYEQWRTVMTRRTHQAPGQPRRYMKVEIDVEKLLTWCARQERPVDAAARAEFAAEKLTEQLGG